MSSTPSTQTSGTSLSGLLARLYWMIVGNALLALLTYSIAFQREHELSASDAGYWLVVVSLVAVRFLDVTLLDGQTGDGTPATPAHWRRYSATVVALALGVWLAAHAIAHFGLLT